MSLPRPKVAGLLKRSAETMVPARAARAIKVPARKPKINNFLVEAEALLMAVARTRLRVSVGFNILNSF